MKEIVNPINAFKIAITMKVISGGEIIKYRNFTAEWPFKGKMSICRVKQRKQAVAVGLLLVIGRSGFRSATGPLSDWLRHPEDLYDDLFRWTLATITDCRN